MIRRGTLPLLMAGLWLLAPTRAVAADATPAVERTDEDEMADSADERWGLKLGVQGDRVSTMGLTGAATYDLFASTTLRASGHSTDYRSDPPVGTPASARTVGAEAGVTQRFGRFGLDVALGHWTATDVVKANEFKLGGTFSQGAFSGGLHTGYRRATFVPFTTLASADFGTGVQLESVVASCRITNTAFGADGRWQGQVFGAHGSMMAYQYGNTRCGLVASGVGSATVTQSSTAFAALAAAPLSRLAMTALPMIGEQPALARSVGQLGISWKRLNKGFGLDYLRQQDYFSGSTSSALYATATSYLGGSTGLEVTLGRARGGNGGPRGMFGGVGLRARF